MPPKGSKRITLQSPRLDDVVSAKVAVELAAVIALDCTATPRALDQMTLHPGTALVNFAQTVRSVSWMLKTVFGVVQSLAKISSVTGSGAAAWVGVRKLKPGNVTPGREETDLSILLITLFWSFGVVGEDAAPVKSGRANSAPTTMKTARTK